MTVYTFVRETLFTALLSFNTVIVLKIKFEYVCGRLGRGIIVRNGTYLVVVRTQFTKDLILVKYNHYINECLFLSFFEFRGSSHT